MSIILELIMEKKTNRTISLWALAALLGFLPLQAGCPTLSQAIQSSSSGDFSVFNNIVDFFRLDDEIGKNPHALNVLKDLVVKVDLHKIAYGTAKRIPLSLTQQYELDIKMPQGYIPTLVASLHAPHRLRAAVFKVLTLPLSVFQVLFTYDFYLPNPPQHEYIANLLLDHPDLPDLLGNVAQGNYRKATEKCRFSFKAPFTFQVSLPHVWPETTRVELPCQ